MCVLYINTVSATGIMLNKHTKVYGHQLSVLKAEFDINWYLSNATLMNVAQRTGLGKKKILIWFRDRRAHMRKNGKDGAASSSEYVSISMYLFYQINTQSFSLRITASQFPSMLDQLFCQPYILSLCLPIYLSA